MTDKVDDVLRYLVKNYPYADELSKTRTTKLVYLIDWESAVRRGVQVTDIKWYFDHYGPFVSDVFDAADEDPELTIEPVVSSFGTRKYLVRPKNSKDYLVFNLSEEEREIIDKVIEKTKVLTWSDFIDFVYNTYPIKNSKRYGVLNLIDLAKNDRDFE